MVRKQFKNVFNIFPLSFYSSGTSVQCCCPSSTVSIYWLTHLFQLSPVLCRTNIHNSQMLRYISVFIMLCYYYSFLHRLMLIRLIVSFVLMFIVSAGSVYVSIICTFCSLSSSPLTLYQSLCATLFSINI